jgi:regulatory protein
VTRPTTGDVRLGVDAWLGGTPRPDDPATSSDPVDPVSQGPGADQEAVARKILLDQLTGQARSRSELAGKLAAKGVPDDVADRLLSRFEEVGLVDDEAFARSWVQSRQAGKGLARRALAQELRRKGVDDEVARDALDEVDPDAEIEAARVLVRRKLRSVARVDHATAVRRLSGMLARKGYPAGVAFRVVREELEEAGRDADQAIDEDLDGVDPDLP